MKISLHDHVCGIASKIAQETPTPNTNAPPTEAGINEVYELAEMAISGIWALRGCLITESSRRDETWGLLAQRVEALVKHPQKERVRKILPLRRMLLGSGIPITSTSLNVVLLCVKLTGEIVDGAIRDFPWKSVDEPHPQFWQAVLRGLMQMPTIELGSFLDDLHAERTCAVAAIHTSKPPTAQAPSTSVPDQMVTMKQMGAAVNKTKAAIEKIKHKLPPPDVPGGSGKASEWEWSKVRPILAEHFHRPTLPEIWPADRFRRR